MHTSGRVKKEMLNGAEEWSKKLKHGGILKLGRKGSEGSAGTAFGSGEISEKTEAVKPEP